MEKDILITKIVLYISASSDTYRKISILNILRNQRYNGVLPGGAPLSSRFPILQTISPLNIPSNAPRNPRARPASFRESRPYWLAISPIKTGCNLYQEGLFTGQRHGPVSRTLPRPQTQKTYSRLIKIVGDRLTVLCRRTTPFFGLPFAAFWRFLVGRGELPQNLLVTVGNRDSHERKLQKGAVLKADESILDEPVRQVWSLRVSLIFKIECETLYLLEVVFGNNLS